MVDVIIPTYKPDERFVELLEKLNKQSHPVHKIIIMNTQEKYFLPLAAINNLAEKYPGMEVHHIKKADFDHGNTRNIGVSYSKADKFLLMTQDAMPKDEYLVENLLKQFEQEKVIVSYARQLPAEDCKKAERFTRAFNYPDISMVKREADIEKMGIKAFFCSDVCAMYDRKSFDSEGGFEKHTIFNEDMIFAGKAIRNGYGIAYAADAEVIHSHNLGNIEQFHRNFDLGVSQKDHPEIFAGIPSESEGIKLVKKTTAFLWKNHAKSKILPMIVQSGFKFVGYKLGKNYTKLSKGFVIRCSLNKDYWRK